MFDVSKKKWQQLRVQKNMCARHDLILYVKKLVRVRHSFRSFYWCARRHSFFAFLYCRIVARRHSFLNIRVRAVDTVFWAYYGVYNNSAAVIFHHWSKHCYARVVTHLGLKGARRHSFGIEMWAPSLIRDWEVRVVTHFVLVNFTRGARRHSFDLVLCAVTSFASSTRKCY